MLQDQTDPLCLLVYRVAIFHQLLSRPYSVLASISPHCCKLVLTLSGVRCCLFPPVYPTAAPISLPAAVAVLHPPVVNQYTSADWPQQKFSTNLWVHPSPRTGAPMMLRCRHNVSVVYSDCCACRYADFATRVDARPMPVSLDTKPTRDHNQSFVYARAGQGTTGGRRRAAVFAGTG